MGKKAWEDETRYSVELTAREMRIIAFCLLLGENEPDELKHNWTKINKATLHKICDRFYRYSDKYLLWGFSPDKIGRKAKRIK